MNLTDLRTAMVAAAAETGVDIQDVYFDFNTVTNERRNKQYPFVFWSIDTADGIKQIRSEQKKFEVSMLVFAVNQITPDADKIPLWDALMDDLDNYLLALGRAQYVSVVKEDVDFELYPAGFVSVDREIAVSYRVTLTLWC